MSRILVSEKISEKCRNALFEMGYDITLLPPFEKLQKGVCCHADLLLFYDGEKIITHDDYYISNKSVFDNIGINIVTTNEKISADYPHDILLNAVLTDEKILFSKNDFTSDLIKEKAEKIINVNQGYTACSTCKVASNAFITTDIGLYNAYKANNIDVLLIKNDGIYLPEYSSCGFIGGSSLVLDEYVCFFGCIEKHGDYEKIKSFVERNNKKIYSLSDEKLTDIGGAVALF